MSAVKIEETLEDLTRAYELTKKYLSLKMQMEDWAGVVGVASDLREIQASIKILKQIR